MFATHRVENILLLYNNTLLLFTQFQYFCITNNIIMTWAKYTIMLYHTLLVNSYGYYKFQGEIDTETNRESYV